MKLLQAIILILTLAFSMPLFSYNYLYIHPTTGTPIGWEPGTTIRYWLDPGPWGSLTNDQARILIQEAMKVWENASPGSGVPKFEFAGYLSEDVNGTNYEKYVSLFQCYTDDLASCASEAQKNLETVIIFDEGDAILNSELCQIVACGANAGAKVFSGSSQAPGNIVQGIAVFGTSANLRPIDSTVAIMVHELGHLLGLAHSYLNQQGFGGQYYPTMFGSPNSDSVTLIPDDIAGISVLYPSATFSSETSTIKGKILRSDGFRMRHVNVIARNIDDPLCEAYSLLSGRSCYFSPSLCNEVIADPSLGGDSGYSLFGLLPGSYTIEVEEVADDNLGLTLAPGLLPNEDIFGDAEFWNVGDVAAESNTLSTTITLAAGETRENVDIILNRSEVTDDRIQYISLDTFTPGLGTRCPEEPPIDYAALIGIDESGTTDGSGSSSSGGCNLVRR